MNGKTERNKTSDTQWVREIGAINRRVQTDAAAFIREEESAYEQGVASAARQIALRGSGRRLIMQCGPSSVGKTTTAGKIARCLRDEGIEAHTVSLDNFYRGLGQAPRLADGSFDYESPEALDLPLLRACMARLMEDGRAFLPEYDFSVGRPKPQRQELILSDDAAVIFEGIHAFDPSLYTALETQGECVVRVFVNTCSRFVRDGRVVLSRRDIRLARRLLRDERFRSSSFHNTLHMWQQVMRGDEAYIFPYSDTADIVVDTTIGYEPCVLAPQLLPRLYELSDGPYRDTARRLEEALSSFVPLSEQFVPKNSVLREFLG